MIEVCIVDDHPMVLDGIAYMLNGNESIRVVHCYNNGNSLLAGLQHYVPDVLLLDIQLPDYNAELLLPKIKENYPLLKILAITSIDNIHRVKKLIRSGCMGYLLKNTGSHTLVKAINTVYEGKSFVSDALQEQIRQDNARIKGEIPAGGIYLTQRELEILQLIIKEFSSVEIAEQLSISINTVEKHRSHLFQKMDVRNVVGLTRKAFELGLI